MAGFLAAELVGRLGQPARWHERESRYVTFQVAHNMTAPRAGAQSDVAWISCIWFNAPKKITEYLLPGTEVFVRGRLTARIYRTAQEEAKVSLDITVSELNILHVPAAKAADSQQAASPAPTDTEKEQQDKTFYREF
ncbi:MAG: single-stranded DNA-binding protein [Bacteroides sp.]|nr:single-stranded DNA-binding protein [Bacteroides sp.]MCM1531431.1 single-stranded DNA-binding protein [Ruminococcus flavefaciens]MCM1554407.1 single-stranded DNA-binding protein [Bacteroides sp.]